MMVSKLTLVILIHYVIIAVIFKILACVLPRNITECYECTAKLLLFHVLSKLIFQFVKRTYLRDKVDSLNKAVLITGCDSGFGHSLAKRLDSRGFIVFAGCLFPMGEGAIELQYNCSKRLHVLGLDVTNDDSVKETLIYVKENLNAADLWAIVNNAGVCKGSDAELSSMKDYEDTMEVNVLGMVRVTKVFLPLLRQSKGRIVNLTSLASQLVAKHLTPYIISKHAAQAFNECLAQEMEKWQIKVISIQPEFFRTGLTNSEVAGRQLQMTFQNLPTVVKNAYGSDYLDDLRYLVKSVFRDSSPKIDIVIDDLESAVTLKDPDSTYICNSNFIHAITYYVYIHLPRYFQSFLLDIYILLFYKSFRDSKSSKNFCNFNS